MPGSWSGNAAPWPGSSLTSADCGRRRPSHGGTRTGLRLSQPHGFPCGGRQADALSIPLTPAGALDECWLLTPPLQDLFSRLGDLSGARRVTIRASERTGDSLVVLAGKVPDHAETWSANVAVASRGGIRPYAGKASMTEEVAGGTYRISGLAFFQTNTAGADSLVRLVSEAAQLSDDDVVLDGYAGGGLLTVPLGAEAPQEAGERPARAPPFRRGSGSSSETAGGNSST